MKLESQRLSVPHKFFVVLLIVCFVCESERLGSIKNLELKCAYESSASQLLANYTFCLEIGPLTRS